MLAEVVKTIQACYASGVDLRNREDANCPKQKGVNILAVEELDEEVLGITRLQTKKAIYLDPRTKKERLRQAKDDVEQAMVDERRASIEVSSTAFWLDSEKNIVRQILQTTILIRVTDVLQTMPQLKMAITNIVGDSTVAQEQCKPHKELMGKPLGNLATDPLLLTVSIGRKPIVVEMR